MILEIIKNELKNHKNKSDIIKIGYIKEYLQVYILKQIFENPLSSGLIFYWWTSLRFLFWLNRLSEDLDFISKDFKDFEALWEILKKYFKSNNIELNYKIQKFRLILNFKNFLGEFNLNYWNSKDLYLKIEISEYFDFCKNFETKIYPIFKLNQSLLIKSLDKNSLFSTKINAVLHRNWEKQIGSEKIAVKWRDIYDLFWYLSNNFTPNINCIIWVKDLPDLKEKLTKIIEKINFKEVILDIENFIEDTSLLNFLQENWKNYLLEKIQEIKI